MSVKYKCDRESRGQGFEAMSPVEEELYNQMVEEDQARVQAQLVKEELIQHKEEEK